ncbi:MAG: hypothetical protein ABIN36_13140 [Ferruginibacter sp.]
MKRPLLLILWLFAALCFMGSCASTKEAAFDRKMALQNSKIDSTECFVQLVDGTIKNYATLKLVTSVYKSPHLLADGKTKIYPHEIISYQNKSHFAVNAGGFSYGGHKSNIAVETLPGFAVRIASGRLNVYIKKYKTNGKVVDEYYLQEGAGQVLAYSPELMDALIKNSAEALDFFNNHKRHVKLTKQLKLTASIFNNAYFNKENNTDTNPNLLAFVPKRKGRNNQSPVHK